MVCASYLGQLLGVLLYEEVVQEGFGSVCYDVSLISRFGFTPIVSSFLGMLVAG